MPAGQVPHIRAVVVDPGHLVGSRPSTPQPLPLPGTRKVWEILDRLDRATIQVGDAIDERKPGWRHLCKSGPLKASGCRHLNGLGELR